MTLASTILKNSWSSRSKAKPIERPLSPLTVETRCQTIPTIVRHGFVNEELAYIHALQHSFPARRQNACPHPPGTIKLLLSNEPEQPSADAKQLSLGIVFLTIFIDLSGSASFSSLPAILATGRRIPKPDQFAIRVSEATGAGDRFTPVLFRGVLGSLYAALQFFFAPIWEA